jgi:hypothetical protein
MKKANEDVFVIIREEKKDWPGFTRFKDKAGLNQDFKKKLD